MRKALPALAAILLASCSAGPAPDQADAVDRPNVIVILADDLGYADLGAQGSKTVSTPHIDKLAADGVRLTNAYANHTVCAPSRAGLLTGKYQHRFGFENNATVQTSVAGYGVPVSEPMLAERLKQRGYATGMFGKWHIGFDADKTPTARGFDTFYGFLTGAMAYTPDGPTGTKTMLRGTAPVAMPAHTTEAFTNEAVAFIEANKDKPFFIYLPYNAVHAPMQSTQPYLSRFASEPDTNRRAYLAMLAAMDDGVGKIVDAVDRNGLGRRTLIVFTSDNGGPTWQTTASNAPLNGVKAIPLEGGIRVPTIMRWTGALPAGKTSPTLAMGFDITTTAQAIAGLPIDPGQDGVNLIPFLTGDKPGDAHQKLFWRANELGAMREGDWKLVKVGEDYYLFNLRTDIGERHDLSAAQPQRLAAMKRDWAAWSGSMKAPAWGRSFQRTTEEERILGMRDLIKRYVTGQPVDPKPLLYGGGPE